MRGHLRKRVAARHLRILRRSRKYGKDAVVLAKRTTRIKIRPELAEDRLTVFGGDTRKTRRGLLHHDVLTLKQWLPRSWPIDNSIIVNNLQQYFTHKTLRYLKGTRTYHWKWSFKNQYYYYDYLRSRRYRIKKAYFRMFRRWMGSKRNKNNLVKGVGPFLSIQNAPAQTTADNCEIHKTAIERYERLVWSPKRDRADALTFLGQIINNPGLRLGVAKRKRNYKKFRAVRNHYNLRTAKYRNSYIYSLVHRWSRATIQKMVTKYRLELIYVDEPLALAPRMFAGSTYRYYALTKFFYDKFGNTFTYIYTSRTYIDKLLPKINPMLLKTFVMFCVDNKDGLLKQLTDKITEFKKAATAELKMKKRKNSPDYCYYLNAALYWGTVEPLEITRGGAADFIQELELSMNTYVLMELVEVYKVVSVLTYLSVIKK